MFEARLQNALAIDLPYPERPPQKAGTPASVLVLFGEKDGKKSLLLTRRTDKVGTHQGQIAFPGGVCEPDERDHLEGEIQAALRETEEEVGISREKVRVIGRLPGLWTVTGFWVTPIVGVLELPVEKVPLQLNSDEIAQAEWIPLELLMNPATYHREFRKIGAVNYPVHVFEVGEFRIWGATGSMIRNLLDRLAATSG